MNSDTSNNIKTTTTIKQSLLRSTTKIEKSVNDMIKDVNEKIHTQQKNNVVREYNENAYDNQQESHQVLPNNDNNINNNEGRTPRNRDRCLFCCTPKVLMAISSIYFILGVIDLFLRVSTYLECRSLYANLDSTTPTILSYDPSTISTLNVKGFQYFNQFDEIWISQTNDASSTNATIQVRMPTDNTKIETSIAPSTYNLNFERKGRNNIWETWWAYWGRCAIGRVEVILPQQQPSPININSHGLDVKFRQNLVSFSHPINLKTTSSDIDIENISATNVLIQSTNGDIKGSISSLQNQLNIESTSGDINVKVNTNTASPRIGIKSTSGDIGLKLGVPNVVVRPVVDVSATSGNINMDVNLVNGITDSQITINASSGDVDLNLHDSFNGQYQVKTTTGDVKIGGNKNPGRIGSADSQGFLSITTTSGDVGVGF